MNFRKFLSRERTIEETQEYIPEALRELREAGMKADYYFGPILPSSEQLRSVEGEASAAVARMLEEIRKRDAKQ